MRLLGALFYVLFAFPLPAVILFLVGMAGDRLGYIGRNVRARAWQHALLTAPSFAFLLFFVFGPTDTAADGGTQGYAGLLLLPAAMIGNIVATFLFLKDCLSGPTSAPKS